MKLETMMNDTDVEVLSTPGYTNSEIEILLKSQNDYWDLVKECHTKDKKIERLEKQISENCNQQKTDWVLLMVGLGGGFIWGVMFCIFPLSHFSYQSGIEKGLEYKRELCQTKYPKSVSAYQDCISL